MNPSSEDAWRHFVTFTGRGLPLRLVSPLDGAALANRNTYFRGRFDAAGRIAACQKIVYGELEFEHRYRYHPNGALMGVEIITADGETESLAFDESGARLVP